MKGEHDDTIMEEIQRASVTEWICKENTCVDFTVVINHDKINTK